MITQALSFLLRAKKNTYAAHGAEISSSRPASHDLRYAEGDFLYLDTYLGGLQFSGEEAIWKDGVPIWSMNYCGRVTGDGFSGDFLKQALLRVTKDAPYRGPSEYIEGEMRYLSRADGDLSWFQGYEEITLSGKRVYECFFHGGEIR